MVRHIYEVWVDGIGTVHHGRKLDRATAIYVEYCGYSRQPRGYLTGAVVVLTDNGVAIERYPTVSN